MSLSILDTDTLTLLQWDRMAIVDRILDAGPGEIGVAIISVQEQFTGWLAAVNRVKGDVELAYAYQRLTDNVRVLSGMRLLTFSETAIRRYNGLVGLKLNIGRMDLRDRGYRPGGRSDSSDNESARLRARAGLDL